MTTRVLTSNEVALLATMAREMAVTYADLAGPLQSHFEFQAKLANDLADLFESDPRVEVS